MVPEVEELLGNTPTRVVKEVRQPQLEMARVVEKALGAKKHALVEAGVGTGKTLAYLIPALAVKKKVLVSTATIGLQSQVINKDLPFLEAAFKTFRVPFKYAIAKGKNNYICRLAVEDAKSGKRPLPISPDVTQYAVAASIGANTGDKQGLGDKVPDYWDQVSAEACVGPGCPYYSKCVYVTDKNRRADADIIVANHALVGMDLSLSSEKSPNPLLGKYDIAIIDEAHKAAEYFRAAFSDDTDARAMGRLLQYANRYGLSYDGVTALSVEGLVKEAFSKYPTPKDADAYEALRPEHLHPQIQVDDALGRLCADLKKDWDSGASVVFNKMRNGLPVDPEERVLAKHLARASRMAERVARAHKRASQEVINAVARMEDGKSSSAVVYVTRDAGGDKTLHITPAYIGGHLKGRLYTEGRSVIVTSATITVNGSFDHVKRELSLDVEDEHTLRVKSPFDYKKNAVLYVSPNIPDPPKGLGDALALDTYALAVAAEVKALADITRGRAFVLFTSRYELEATAKHLMRMRLNIIKQDKGTTAPALVEKYLEQAQTGKAPILLGLKSFWEGVSIEGEDLSCVIIVKLPFPPMTDPVYKALCEAAGEKAFATVTVPAMIKDIQQGAGRLIRTSSDIGIVAILDKRVQSTGYGSMVVNSLPFPSVSTKIEKVAAWYKKRLSEG